MIEQGAIPLSSIRPRHAAHVSAEPGAVTLVMPPQPWAVGAEAEFDLPEIATRARVVRVRMSVENGVIGLGWLSNDAWVVRASADAAMGETDIELIVPARTPGGRLVFDNWTKGGQPARARIREIEVLQDRRAPARATVREMFARSYVPTDHFGELAQNFKHFEAFDDLLELIPPGPVWRNFALNAWEFAQGASVLTSYPWNIALPVADVCNARCVFCTSWIDGRKLLDLDALRLFEPALRRAALIGLLGLGEPMAHPQFGELCDRLAALLDPVARSYTITNGFFLHKWRDRLERINLQAYSISLNAATAATHDAVMGLGPDALPRILDCLGDLTRLGKQVQITLVVTRQNLPEIPQFIALGNRLGVDRIRLRSLLPQAQPLPGLNYHLLPAYRHPDFERLRASALDAILGSGVPVEADPDMWGQRVFPEHVEQDLEKNPPPVVKRAEALRSRDLRHRNEHLYHQAEGVFRGQPFEDGAISNVSWADGRLHVRTPKGPGAFAAEVALACPEEGERLRVEIDVACEAGQLGFGLRAEGSDAWPDRAFVDPGVHTVLLEASGRPTHLVIHNGGNQDCAIGPSRGHIDAVRLQVGERPVAVDWSTLFTHNSGDPMDDGTNPLGRRARFACQAVYSSFYVDKFFYRVIPCCYMIRVPGFEEVRLDSGASFAEVWNNPAFVELRRRLKEGPLFGACRRCPEKW